MQLSEQYRPKTFTEVAGQDKAIEKIDQLRKRGLTGRALLFSGASGTGKTTLARLIAQEVADEWAIEEIDAETLTPKRVQEWERASQTKGFGRGGRAYIVNEMHGLSSSAVRQLLVTLEADRIPPHVVWIFTTTSDNLDLFGESTDAHPLLSRCSQIPLARRDLARPFAERAAAIAQKEGLNGKPIEAYLKLIYKHKCNLRAALQEIESGGMLD